MNTSRHSGFGPQLDEQIEDLRLDGRVERRRRLVGDQKIRLAGERHGDHQALVLAAGEFVRIEIEAAPASGMPTMSSSRSASALAARARHSAMQRKRLGDLPADAEAPD